MLYRNNAGALAYLCVYKARDYKDGAGAGIGGGSGFTRGWADMNNDGKLDLWGPDLILEAGTPAFNAGPIGSQPAHWHGYANEEGLGYMPPWKGVVGVYDFNGDGTPDFLRQGTLMLRTPNSIYQADYVPIVWELPSAPPGVVINGKLELRPAGSLVLDGEGASQAISVVHVMPDLTEQVIPHTHENLDLSLSGNPELGLPYATLIGNVLATVQPITFVSTLSSSEPVIASAEGRRVLGVSPGFANLTAGYLGRSAAALVAVDEALGDPAATPLLVILDLQRQGDDVTLGWYSTPPADLYTPFTVWTSTNLVTGPWVPLPVSVPRHPSGFHNRTDATDGSPSIFYKVTSP